MILAEVVCFHIHKNLYDDNNGKVRFRSASISGWEVEPWIQQVQPLCETKLVIFIVIQLFPLEQLCDPRVLNFHWSTVQFVFQQRWFKLNGIHTWNLWSFIHFGVSAVDPADTWLSVGCVPKETCFLFAYFGRICCLFAKGMFSYSTAQLSASLSQLLAYE